MPTVKTNPPRKPPTALESFERLRHARLARPEQDARGTRRPLPRASMALPRYGAAAPKVRTGGLLPIPGPAYLPEVDAFALLAERRATRPAAPPAVIPPRVTLPTAPEAEPVRFGVRGLLGW